MILTSIFKKRGQSVLKACSYGTSDNLGNILKRGLIFFKFYFLVKI